MTAEPNSTPRPVTIDIVSDVMCPWCFIGKRRLEKALALAADVPVNIRWQPFQLDATLPSGGKDRQKYLDEKFGGPEKAEQVYARIREAGDGENIPFAFDKITRSPNTFDAHRLILWAEAGGHQDQIVEALFQAYFIDGRDLTKTETLVAIGAAAGMDAKHLMMSLTSNRDKDTVSRALETARSLGIYSVPSFIIDNRFLAQGAQPPEMLADALRRAYADRLANHPDTKDAGSAFP
ncbi:MAG: disulfide bond formation protein DsbA [Hyphomicrobiales bacterium]|nr:MAG: disulfide bond formation protein DsbA [Hyphomicrobiales bacterium]